MDHLEDLAAVTVTDLQAI
ncbi:S-adenosyl-L-homocysteine hydrolase [Janibacter sp. HTCC2649]|nr:S-adenosyl-L-homocysteine hydrolase [Janibacter sp. HTCC2649]